MSAATWGELSAGWKGAVDALLAHAEELAVRSKTETSEEARAFLVGEADDAAAWARWLLARAAKASVSLEQTASEVRL